jgi:hypothetical protein
MSGVDHRRLAALRVAAELADAVEIGFELDP